MVWNLQTTCRVLKFHFCPDTCNTFYVLIFTSCPFLSPGGLVLPWSYCISWKVGQCPLSNTKFLRDVLSFLQLHTRLSFYSSPVRHVLSFMSVLLDMCCPLCSSGPTHVVLYVSPVRHVLSFIMSCQICVVLYASPVRHVLSFTQILSDTCCPLGLSYQTFVVLYLSPLDTCCPWVLPESRVILTSMTSIFPNRLSS